jgi:hypothetical protein
VICDGTRGHFSTVCPGRGAGWRQEEDGEPSFIVLGALWYGMCEHAFHVCEQSAVRGAEDASKHACSAG